MEDIKKNLIDLIKKFGKKYLKCGKIFLGAVIDVFIESGDYLVYTELKSYILYCGKCPDCGQVGYDGFQKIC